jgi:hypothetical protein
MKQIGPGPAVPITPATAAPPARGVSPLVWIVLLVVVAGAWFALRPRENHAEKLATDVTKAVINNNMQPVEKEFNALARPELENRQRVGRLSDQIVALGPLKSVKEDTPAGATAGKHHFVVTFEKATWDEDLTLDADGKISAFHIHPPEDTGK